MDVNEVIVELNRRIAALEFMVVGVLAATNQIDQVEKFTRRACGDLLQEHPDAKKRFEEILAENFAAARSQVDAKNG